MPDTYAVYDAYGKKVKGGFASAVEAETWLAENPIWDVYDADEEYIGSFLSAYEAEVNSPDGGEARERDHQLFDILPEVI